MVLPLVMAGAGLISNVIGSRQADRTQREQNQLYRDSANLWNRGSVSGPFGGGSYNNGRLSYDSPFAALMPQLFGQFTQSGQMGQEFLSGGGGIDLLRQRSQALESTDPMLGPLQGGMAGFQQWADNSLGSLYDPNNTAAARSAEALGILNAQAKPQEAQIIDRLGSYLQNTGRGAVTGPADDPGALGGGLLTRSAFQGLADAGLERQLRAQDYGINAANMEERLRQGAFSRFADSARGGADLNTMMFNRQYGLGQDAYSRERNLLGLPMDLAAQAQNYQAGAGGLFDIFSQLSQRPLDQLYNFTAGQSGAMRGAASGVAPATNVSDAFGSFFSQMYNDRRQQEMYDRHFGGGKKTTTYGRHQNDYE